MITGFNTDIEHGGVVYHVQTEDKGLDSPIILSLVYVGGTILASKRSPYADLIEQGFSDEALAERLKRQHRLICAAINSGRINDLKKMGSRSQATPVGVGDEPVDVAEPELPAEVETASAPPPVVEEFEFDYEMTQQWTPPPPKEEETQTTEEEAAAGEQAEEPAWTAAEEDEVSQEEPVEVVALPDGLIIDLLDDEEFYSGQPYTLRVLIANRSAGDEKPLANAAVSIKILGTTFRPLIYTLRTERDGVATVATEIPQFSSGRAAVLVRAVVKDQAAELRRIIHPVAA